MHGDYNYGALEPDKWGWVWPVAKWAIILAVISLVVFGLVKCNQNLTKEHAIDKNQAAALLSGEHPLRKLTELRGEKNSWSLGGVFFGFTGGIYGGGGSYSETKIIFSWQMNNGKFALSEVLLAKVFVNLNEKIEIPNVQFEWKNPHNYIQWYEVNEAMRNIVVAVTINCHPDHWPREIQMPLNRE
ncbi:MAG: hypothetical protein V1867_05585 [Candidatus Falkowbacteria bacterium]